MTVGNGRDWDDTELEEEEGDAPEDDEKDESEEDVDESEKEESEEDNSDEESKEEPDEDGDDEESEESEESDSKTKKIIALKKRMKEANQRIAELESKAKENEDDEEVERQVSEQVKKWKKQGFDDDDLEDVTQVFRENITAKLKEERSEWNALSDKYPSIKKYQSQIQDLRKKMPTASIEDIYLAKFFKETEYEKRTKIEQETLYKHSKAKEKAKGGVVGGGTKGAKGESIKLSESDARAYEIYKKKHPSATKKQFMSLLDEEEELT